MGVAVYMFQSIYPNPSGFHHWHWGINTDGRYHMATTISNHPCFPVNKHSILNGDRRKKKSVRSCSSGHWNGHFVLTKFWLLAVPEEWQLPLQPVASDEIFAKMTTFPFQWMYACLLVTTPATACVRNTKQHFTISQTMWRLWNSFTRI